MPSSNNSQKPARFLLFFLVIVLIFVAGFYTAKIDIVGRLDLENSKYVLEGEKIQNRNGVDVGLLWEVWATLEREYIDPEKLDGKDMLYGATEGLVEGIGDTYTSFLNPEQTKEYLSSNKREFQGIGTTLAEEGEFVIIESPIDGSPAQRAGLKALDVILKVDGVDMQGKVAIEVAKVIRGEANTKVKISYYRPSTNETNEVEIVREKIDLENISVENLENGIALLKVYQFTEADVPTFKKEWDKNIDSIVQSNPKGVIIDLRNNPGGFVDAVRYSLGDFLKENTVVFMEETRSGQRTEYKVNREGRLLDVPIVIIVNEGSASASEIFAGAIQDHNRGEIVGTKTVGKGVEQKLIDLSDGSMLQVVFQKWLTPKGRNITKEEPITPDTIIEEPKAQLDKAIEQLVK